MPNAFYAKKSLRITLEKYVYAVLFRALSHQFFNVPKVFPTTLSKGVRNALTLCRLNKKHLYSTVTS